MAAQSRDLTPLPVPLLPGPLLNQAVRGKAVLRSRSQFATLKRGQNIKPRPYVFTEPSAVMLATNQDLARKIEVLERKVGTHDAALQPSAATAKRPIGFVGPGKR